MNREFLSIVSLTVTHLKQVTDRVLTFRQQQLAKLDQAVNSYLQKRKQSKNNTQQQESFQTRIRSQLMAFEEKNDFLLKQLEIITHNFQSQKEQVKCFNQTWKSQNQSFINMNPYEQLCKELLVQLSQYKIVSQHLERLEALKKEGHDKTYMIANAQQYFQKVDEIMGDEDEQTMDFYKDSNFLHKNS